MPRWRSPASARCRVAHREDGDEDDRDRVDEAERDRAAEREDAPSREGREGLEELAEVAAVDELSEVGAERREDHRQGEAPEGKPRGDCEEAGPPRGDIPAEEDAAHAAPPLVVGSSASPSSWYSSRKASSRRAGSIVRSVSGAAAIAARNGRTSPREAAAEMAVDRLDVRDARDAAQIGGRPGEPHLHRPVASGEERADLLERHEPAVADDRDAVADPLDLREDVRREEDRAALRPQLVEDRVERPLHERVEALGRLVEDRQLRVVLERLDDPELLAHPPGVVADRPGEVRRRARAARRGAAGGPPGARRTRRDSRADRSPVSPS